MIYGYIFKGAEDENYVMENLQNKINQWENTWDENEKLIESLVFSSSKILERGWRVLEWETLHYCYSHLRGTKIMCKFFYIERQKFQ